MTTLTYWACKANKDQTEGRGPMYIVCYAETLESALDIVNSPAFYNKYGVCGTKPYENGKYDVEKVTFNIFNDLNDYLVTTKAIEREIALSKLTETEKVALGLTDTYQTALRKLTEDDKIALGLK